MQSATGGSVMSRVSTRGRKLALLASFAMVLLQVVAIVPAHAAPATITYTTAGLDALQANEVSPFWVTIHAVNPDNDPAPGDLVLHRATLTQNGNPVVGQDATYPDVGDDPNDPSTWSTVTTDGNGQVTFGPAGGFPYGAIKADAEGPSGASTPFRAAIGPGTYNLAFELLDMPGATSPYGVTNVTFTVGKEADPTASQDIVLRDGQEGWSVPRQWRPDHRAAGHRDPGFGLHARRPGHAAASDGQPKLGSRRWRASANHGERTQRALRRQLSCRCDRPFVLDSGAHERGPAHSSPLLQVRRRFQRRWLEPR